MSRASIALRIGILWVIGISAAAFMARHPGYWHDPRVPFAFPWLELAVVALWISAECLVLFGILAWLPIRPYWLRTAIATVVFLVILVWSTMYQATDQPGWVYANPAFIGSVFLVLLLELIAGGVQGMVARFRSHSTDAA